MIARIVVSLVVLILIELLAASTIISWANSLKQPFKSVTTVTYIVLTVGVFAFFMMFPKLRNWNQNRDLRALISVLIMAIVIGKLIIASVSIFDWLKRFVAFMISMFYSKQSVPAPVATTMTRSSFITKMALLLGGTASATMLYGLNNRYNYKVRKHVLDIPHWREKLSGLKIVQISDIHSGSFTNTEAVKKGVDLINSLGADIIVFTGDLVNNTADEMTDYISIFQQLKAPLGIYSITGNHDYADYMEWPSLEAKQKNFEQLVQTHKDLGWRLLLNEHVPVRYRDTDLVIIGVENISGKSSFISYGNLEQAANGAEMYEHSILLSHDPSHWDSEVLGYKYKIDLTLSGHTHGMQFGIEIPGLKWSPVKYIYNRWAGIYKENDQYLYVNRGFGFLGYPGRVGILPEITLFEVA